MNDSTMMLVMMLAPIAACVLLFALPARAPRPLPEAVHVTSLAIVALFGCAIILRVFMGAKHVEAIGFWLHIDALGAVFLGLACLVALLCGICSIAYLHFEQEEGSLDKRRVKRFYALYNLFVFTVLLVIASNNIIMMWVAIEATTLATVFLVGTHRTKQAMEAAWKYLIVCTAGVAFGLYGTLLVYANAADVMADPHLAVFWTKLLPYASSFDPMLIHIAFVFAAIGFGTKAGLFPMHTWMPDAYQQTPAPVSGLMSGVLAKCAMLVLIKFYVVAIQSVGPSFPQTIMLILGAASIVFGAFGVFAQSDLKRKLAYSSCENIGIVAVCLGFGGSHGIAFALLHCLFHGLAKALMFCLSGNVMMRFKTFDLDKIQGVVRVAPATATLLGCGLLALSGLPPFALFISEVGMFVAGVGSGLLWLVVAIGVALTVVIAAFTFLFLKSVLGKAPESVKKREVGPAMLVPELSFAALLLWFGLAPPAPLASGIEEAAVIVMQDSSGGLEKASLLSDTMLDLG